MRMSRDLIAAAVFALLMCIVPSRANAQAIDEDGETISDDEIEMWLNTYAIDSSVVRMINIVSPLLPDRCDTVADSLSVLPEDTLATIMPGDTILHDPLPCDSLPLDTIYGDSISETDTIETDSISAVSDTVCVQPSEEKQCKKRPKPRQRKTSYLDKIKKPTAEELIAELDTIAIRRDAILESSQNTLFMDWVLSYPDVPRVTAFDGNDSTVQELRKEARAYIRQNNPELYKFHSSALPEFTDINVRHINSQISDNLKLKVDSKLDRSTIDIDMPKAPFWKHGAQFQLQATQNYISKNWYNGGTSTLNGLANINAYINYNNSKNIQWDNKLEWRLGLNSAGSDTLRKVRVNEDFLKVNSKLGIKAFGTFFYTAEAEFSTPFFNMFNENSYERTASTFSPIRLYLSAGLDYKYKDKLSVFVSPLSYKFVYVMDTTVHEGVDPANSIARKVGIKQGKKDLNQLGGLVRINFKHKFSDQINIETKFSFYTNYVGDIKGVELDWEIIGNFLINRFLSAKVTLHPRYDNTIETTDGTKPKIQFYELISLGFNYQI